MENSTKKSGGVVIPKKKRSLDLKSLYESRSSEVGGSKKNDSGENEQKDVKAKRKSRKEISLNSIEPDAKKSRKDDGNGMKSEMGFREKLDMWSKELHGISLALDDNGSPFNIPKRPRGSVGRKKLESDQGSETWRISNSVDRVVAFKAEDRKFDDKGGPTDQLIKPITFTAGKDGALKSRLAVNSVGSQNKSKRKAESKSTMNSSGVSVKLNKVGSDEGVDRVGAFEPEVTKSEDKGGPNDQSVRSENVTGKVIGLNKKSKRKGDPKSTMDSSSLNMKLKKVGSDQGVDSVGAFEAEVTESEDKDGPIDQSVRSVTLSAGNDVAGKFVGYKKKSKRKADSKSTMNFRSSNVKSKKKVGSDEVIDHVGASEAEDTKSADKGCPDDQSVWSAIFSASNDLEGKVFGLNRKSKRKADPKSTMNSSSSNVKLKKRVGAKASDNVGAFVAEVTKSEDKDGRNDQSVRSATLSAGNDVGGKVRGLNKKSKQKAGIKSTMKNSSSSNVKLKKKVGADETIVRNGALEVEFTKSENKSGPNDQPVMPDTFYEGDDVVEKNIGLNKKSKQNAKRISTANASSSNVKLNKGADEAVDRLGEIEAEVTISEDKGPIDQSVRSVTYTAGNDVARKLVGLYRKSKRKAHPKSTMNASSSNVKLKKVGADETFDCVGESEAEVIISKDRDVAGKLVGVNKKSKRKSDPKSTMNSSSSNVKLKKVGADESINHVGAFVAEITKYDDKGVTIDQSVRSDTLSACNDVVGKVAAVNKKSKRKADPRSTLNSNTSNMMLKKVGAGEAIDRVGSFEAEFTKSEDKDDRNEQLVRSVTLGAGQDGISNSKLAGKVIGSNAKCKRKAGCQSTMTSSSSNKKLKKVGADEDVVQVGAFKAEVTKPEDKGGPDDQLVGSGILSADKDGVSDLSLAGKVIGTNTKAKRKTDAKSTLNLNNSNAKLKQKVEADEIKGRNYCQPDSVRHVVKESKLVVNNGNAPSKKRLSNSRKKKDLVFGGDSVEPLVNMSEPAVGSSAPNSPFIDFLDEDDDDDEENLEQNAARMLSSRFDPRCTGFTSKKKSSVFQTVDELSFPVSSARDSIRRRAKSLGDGASDSGDDNSRELRPRGGDKGRSLSRKRRHFYDIPTRDLDPRWVLNRRIKIFWPLDESWYFGYVTGYHSEANLHHLKYDDGEEEWVNLEEENFRLLLLRTEVPGKGKSRRRSTAAKDTHTEQTARPVDDASCIGDDDSEPIASWLAAQSQRVKALSKSSQRRKISQNYPSLGSSLSSEKTDNSNGDADASRSMGKKSGCESTSADKILVCGTVDKSQFVYVRKKFQKKRAGNSSVSKGGKARGSAPWPVTKRDMLGYGCVDGSDKQLRSFDDRSKLTLNDVLLESKEFRIQICLPLLPYLEFCWGIGFFQLFHDIFMLQHGVIVTTSPAVFLELLFVDSNLGLRSVLFEGCLIQALAIVFLILTVFSHSDENYNGELKLPVTSIRFQLSSVHNLRKQHVFAFHSFFGLARSKWLYLESKILQQCLLIKQLSVSECTYCNIKELECGILRPCKTHVGSEFSPEDFRKNFERENLPTGVSEEAFNTGKPANVPQFTLFSAAPNFFLSLHLQSLMKHGSAGANFQHQDPLCSPESSGNGGGPVAECFQFTEHENSQLDSEASAFRGLSTYQQDLEMDVVLAGNAIENANSSDKLHKGLSSDQQVDMPFDRKGCISRQTSDASWNAHDGFVLNSNIMGPKGSLKRRKSSTISSLLGQHSLVLPDSQPNFMHHGFSNGPRKPRTQVQYTLPFAGYEIYTRQETSSPGSIPCKRIRRASLRKIPDGSGNNPKSLELLTCSANVLITNDDRGWRECGAHIFSEVADDNEWRLAVKISGITRFSYKVKHILQPGSTNRYSHAMIWKGGKDWVLEFPDRNQWMLFKELYEECHNRNIRAACVKNIPIPGVRLVDESDDIRDEVPFVRNPTMYFRQVQTDAEMAMDPSYILYDMDSDDEQWLATQRNCTDKHKIEKISEEFFEMAMNMFEKVSYSQQRDNLTDAEIEEVAIVIGSVEAAKLIYLHWRLKREKTCMPLIRHLQPPPWQRYQKQVKEWEHNVSRSIQEKISPPEKPPMFAFCFKPRGLDVPNRTSKQRSHRKFSVSALHHASSGDHSLLVSGRRSNGHAYGDEKTLYASGVHDSSDVSPSLHPSTRILSSRDAHFTLSASVSEWKVNNDPKVHKNKRKKKLGSYPRTATGDNNNSNGIRQWNTGPTELFSHSHYYLDGPHNEGGPKRPDISDPHEFHVRDALGASKHARTVAKLKRQRAQKLFCKAEFAIHKAVSALLQAEAIKDFFENSNGAVN